MGSAGSSHVNIFRGGLFEVQTTLTNGLTKGVGGWEGGGSPGDRVDRGGLILDVLARVVLGAMWGRGRRLLNIRLGPPPSQGLRPSGQLSVLTDRWRLNITPGFQSEIWSQRAWEVGRAGNPYWERGGGGRCGVADWNSGWHVVSGLLGEGGRQETHSRPDL